jgi:GNAT superfamily N-acetyltransferase
VEIGSLQSPTDHRLNAVGRLLEQTFPDPNTTLGVDRMREFLGQPAGEAGREFFILVAEQHGTIIGTTIFSYVPATNCGFSEYLVVRRDFRAQGIGRRLFDARLDRLQDGARRAGHAHPRGLFIEVDSPTRTPPHLLEAERTTAMDAHERLRIFAHLGFQRVDLAYVQPPLADGKQPVDYLDLLFRPHTPRASLPRTWITDTLLPIWRAWSPAGSFEVPASAQEVALRPLDG